MLLTWAVLVPGSCRDRGFKLRSFVGGERRQFADEVDGLPDLGRAVSFSESGHSGAWNALRDYSKQFRIRPGLGFGGRQVGRAQRFALFDIGFAGRAVTAGAVRVKVIQP